MIGLLEAVDERAALDRYAAARRLDPRMRFDEPRLHREIELDDVAALPGSIDSQIAPGSRRRRLSVDARGRGRAPAGHAEAQCPRRGRRLLDGDPYLSVPRIGRLHAEHQGGPGPEIGGEARGRVLMDLQARRVARGDVVTDRRELAHDVRRTARNEVPFFA